MAIHALGHTGQGIRVIMNNHYGHLLRNIFLKNFFFMTFSLL